MPEDRPTPGNGAVPNVREYRVSPELLQQIVNVLTQLPYNQIAGLMQRVQAEAVPIYERSPAPTAGEFVEKAKGG